MMKLDADLIGKKFGRYSIFSGVLLIILGTVGFLLPNLMSIGTVVFVSTLLIIGSFIWATHTYRYARSDIMEWIKPTLLFVSGALMLFYPAGGIAAVGMLLAFYLLLDAFSSFALAQSIRPAPNWGWMAVNGIFSLLLALLFLVGWPATSIWLVGLYVSISLFFDGAALIAIGFAINKVDKP